MASSTYGESEFVSKLKMIFDLNISENDLKNCNSDIVTKIYICFVRDFGASVEKLSQVPFDAPASVHQYPDMYKSVSFVMHLAKVVKYYLDVIYGENDFCPMDIVDPDWSRTKKFFTMLLDFYGSISEKFHLFEEVENKVALTKERFEKKMDSIEMLKKEISRRKLQKAEDEMRAEKLRSMIEAEKKSLVEKQVMKERLKGRLEGANLEINELTNKTKETQLQILEAEEKVKMLQTQVVLEEEYQEIEERNQKVDEQRKENEEIKETIKALKDNLQIQQKADSVLRNTLIPALEDFKMEVRKRDEALEMKRDVENKMTQVGEKDEEVSRTLQILNERMALLNEERSQLLSMREIKKAGMKEEIKQLKLNLEELQGNNEEYEIAQNDLNNEHKQVLEEIEAEEQHLKMFMDRVSSFTVSVTSKMNELYNEDLEKLKSMPPYTTEK